MHPAIEKRLKRLRADLMFAEDQEIAYRRLLRARVEFATKLRRMLQARGVDPDTIVMLKHYDEAAAELAGKPDTPAWRDAEAAWEAAQPNQDREIDDFYREIVRLALIHFADGHQPGPGGSLAEWHAWCVATPVKGQFSIFIDSGVKAYQQAYHRGVANELANRSEPVPAPARRRHWR